MQFELDTASKEKADAARLHTKRVRGKVEEVEALTQRAEELLAQNEAAKV